MASNEIERCPRCFQPWCPNCGQVPQVYRDVWALLEVLRALKVALGHLRERIAYPSTVRCLSDAFAGTGRDLDGWIEHLGKEYAP